MRLRHNEHLFSCRPLIILNVAINSSLMYLSFICLRLWFSPSLSSLTVPLFLSVNSRSIHFTLASSVAAFDMLIKARIRHVFSKVVFHQKLIKRNFISSCYTPAWNPSSYISFAENPWLKYGADQRNVSDVDLFRVNQLPRRRRMQLFYSSVLANSVFEFHL